MVTRDEGGDPTGEEDISLSNRFERGWFWGGEAFRDQLNGRVEKLTKRKSRNYRSGTKGPGRDQGRKQAERIVAEGAMHYGLSETELGEDRRGDWKRSLVTWAISMETSVPRVDGKTAEFEVSSEREPACTTIPESADQRVPKEVREWKES